MNKRLFRQYWNFYTMKKRTLLVRGYDNEAKLKVVLSCLNNEFQLGIIRTSVMSDNEAGVLVAHFRYRYVDNYFRHSFDYLENAM